MNEISIRYPGWAKGVIAAALVSILLLTSLYSYLLFHTLSELFSIIIAGAIFVLLWNFRRFYKDSFLLFIGAAYVFTAVFDLLHTLAFPGMGVFQGASNNLTAQLWLAARYLQSIALLLAPLLLGRRVRIEWFLLGFALLSGLVLLSIFAWGIFPLSYVDGVGQTRFKIFSEYAVDLILVGAAAHLLYRRRQIDRLSLQYLLWSIGFSVAAELAFTYYISMMAFPNLLGHLLKIAAYYMVYKATIETEAGTIYTDMTRLRQAQAALRQSEAVAQLNLVELTTIYRQSPVGLCFLDPQLRYQSINETLARINGLPATEHIGKSIQEVLPPVVVEQLAPMLRRVVTTGEPVNEVEVAGTRIPGTSDHRCWLISFHPVRRDNAGLMGISGVVQDITDRKRTEQALLASERTLKLFIEYAPTAIAMLDRHMRYIAASRRYYQDYRIEDQDIIGRSHYEVFPEISERWKEIHRRCLTGAVETMDEDPFPRADGSVDWVRWAIHPWYEAGGDVGGIIIFSEVITERKLAQAELAQAHLDLQEYAEQLKRSNQELELFAFVASHDLQEPLRKIRMFGDALKRQLEDILSIEAQDSLNRMQNAAERMQTMINGLLDLSRVNTRGGNFEPANLTDLVEEVLTDLDPRIRATGGQVLVEALPEAVVDVVQARQLFMNLIGNALKFHKPDVPPIIRVTGARVEKPKSACVKIAVADNGIGFDEQFSERIFQPFQRLNGKAEFEGTGLGLSICKKIVERHHGKIEVRSAPGVGTTFEVTLPCKPAAR